MIIPGAILLMMAYVYYTKTKDTPLGNFKDLKASDPDFRMKSKDSEGGFLMAIKDYRVWLLFVIYGACFGVELTINNIAALYYVDQFSLSVQAAGAIAMLFGLMNLFARTLGGMFGDKAGKKWGLRGRVIFLFVVLLGEGLALMLFANMGYLPVAIATMIGFSLFVQMSEGATFSVVPFINKKALGSISGIVGAGGNAGAVAAGFLMKAEGVTYQNALFIIGGVVAVISVLSLLIRFSEADEENVQKEMQASLEEAKRILAHQETVKEEKMELA